VHGHDDRDDGARAPRAPQGVGVELVNTSHQSERPK
jgi:hypothetical protein